DLEKFAGLDPDHPVLAPGNDPLRHTGGQPVGHKPPAIVLELKIHYPLCDQQCLVFLAVVLQAEHLAGVYVDHLAEVLLGDREAVLPAPGFFDEIRQAGAARAFLPARRAAARPAPWRTPR